MQKNWVGNEEKAFFNLISTHYSMQLFQNLNTQISGTPDPSLDCIAHI
jgi:hypothetical protein